MKTTTGAGLLVETLKKLGCTTIFGIPGIHNLDIYDQLIESGLRHVTARNEAGAGFMADGYARTTGRTGVALVITGPGLTNAATAVAEAFHDSVPLLLISSQLPRRVLKRDTGYLHELHNSSNLARSFSKESRTVPRAELIESYISAAYALTREGRPGPVHVEIPLDVLREQIGSKVSELPGFNDCCAALAASNSPLIVAGGGAAAAAAEIRTLAEKLSAPVVTTLGGKGVLPEDHALSLGTRLHLPSVRELVKRSDLVIGIGTNFSPTDLWEEPLKLDGTLIQINTEPADFDNDLRADIVVCGDAAEVASGLAAALPDRSSGTGPSGGIPALLERCGEELSAVLGLGEQQVAFFRGLFGAIRSVLPRDGILVTDMTTPAYMGLSEYPAYVPRSFLHPVGFGTLGFALPAAVGACLANPERPVCVLSGDGGFQFTMQELAVACEESLTLPIIVFSNGGYGEIRRTEDLRHPGKRIAVDIRGPGIVELAAAYGIPGLRITDPGNLRTALAEAFERNNPTLIEVVQS